MTAREPLDANRIFPPEERSLAVMLQARAKAYGDKPLVQSGERQWSFTQALDLAARSGGRLQAAGLSAGDRIALMCENRPASRGSRALFMRRAGGAGPDCAAGGSGSAAAPTAPRR